MDRYEALISQRLNEDGPWGSLNKIMLELDDLLEQDNPESDQTILEETKEFLIQRFQS